MLYTNSGSWNNNFYFWLTLAEAHSEYDMLPCPADTHVATNVSTPELNTTEARRNCDSHNKHFPGLQSATWNPLMWLRRSVREFIGRAIDRKRGELSDETEAGTSRWRQINSSQVTGIPYWWKTSAPNAPWAVWVLWSSLFLHKSLEWT